MSPVTPKFLATVTALPLSLNAEAVMWLPPSPTSKLYLSIVSMFPLVDLGPARKPAAYPSFVDS